MAKKKKKKASKKKKKLKKTKKKRIKKKKTKKNLKRAKKKKVKIKKKKTVLKKSTPKTPKDPVFKVFPEWKKKGLVNQSSYKKMYEESVSDNEKFWEKHGKRIDWIKPYSQIKDVTYSKEKVDIKWFYDGTLNVAYNCIDRHLPKKANDTAIIFEGDDPNVSKNITYQELKDEVCKLANGLKEIGIKKGDRVTIYMPMVPHAVYSMLACARIGAIHSVVFGGFSAESLAGRILDCKSEYVITADQAIRGAKPIPLKQTTNEALTKCPDVKNA